MIRPYKMTLQPGEEFPQGVTGNYIRFQASSARNTPVRVNATDSNGRVVVSLEFYPTSELKRIGGGYETVWFRNDSTSEVTVTFILGEGDFDQSDDEVFATLAPNDDAKPRDSLAVPASGGGSVSVAENLSRRAITIRASRDNSGAIFMVDGTGRFPLYAGDTFREEITGAVEIETDEDSEQTAYVYEVV